MPDTTPAAGQLLELTIGDSAASWEAAGFSVVDGAFRLGEVTIRLVGEADGRGLQSWSLQGVDGDIDGLRSLVPQQQPERVPHANSVTVIDHVVVETSDFARTIPALEAAGFELRRTRTFNFGDAERQQCFFWLGSVILELIGLVDAAPDAAPPARFWGLALTTPDIEATAALLGDATSTPKPALQKGRFISTLRTRDLGISVPVAFMSPHVAD